MIGGLRNNLCRWGWGKSSLQQSKIQNNNSSKWRVRSMVELRLPTNSIEQCAVKISVGGENF